MRNFKLAILILTSLIVSTPTIATNLLANAVTISLYNVQTQQPQAIWHVGDTVGYIVTATLPIAAQSQKATIDVSLSVNIHGITLPIKVSQKITAPVTGYDKTTQTSSNLPINTYMPTTKFGQFVIPPQVSGDSITVSAKVSVQSVGSVSKKVTLAVSNN